jgi:hypothetical protein
MSFELIGAQLLRELESSPFLPLYNSQLMRATAKEMGEHFTRLHHYSSITSAMGTPDRQQFIAAFTLYNVAFWRNRRFALSYLQERLRKIQQIYWYIDREKPPAVLNEILSPQETGYFTKYKEIMNSYFRDIGGHDLTIGYFPPDEAALVSVKIKENFNGFEKGKEYLVRGSEIERAVYKGFCELK